MKGNPIIVRRREGGEKEHEAKCPNCGAHISLFLLDGNWRGEEASETECKRCDTTVQPMAIVVDEDN